MQCIYSPVVGVTCGDGLLVLLVPISFVVFPEVSVVLISVRHNITYYVRNYHQSISENRILQLQFSTSMTTEQTISSMHACVNAAIFRCDWCDPWQRSVLQDFTDQLQSAMDVIRSGTVSGTMPCSYQLRTCQPE